MVKVEVNEFERNADSGSKEKDLSSSDGHFKELVTIICRVCHSQCLVPSRYALSFRPWFFCQNYEDAVTRLQTLAGFAVFFCVRIIRDGLLHLISHTPLTRPSANHDGSSIPNAVVFSDVFGVISILRGDTF